eukprot:scaffold166445_cov33-Tisochrysis_lutea.AAC.2
MQSRVYFSIVLAMDSMAHNWSGRLGTPVPLQLAGKRFYVGPSLAKFNEAQLRHLIHAAGGSAVSFQKASFVVGTNQVSG